MTADEMRSSGWSSDVCSSDLWPVAAGGPQGFRLDPVHNRVLVALDHADYSTALGTVTGSTGLVAFDPVDWSSARVDVSVPLERIDFGDEEWNAAARRNIGAASWTQARFISDRSEEGRVGRECVSRGQTWASVEPS